MIEILVSTYGESTKSLAELGGTLKDDSSVCIIHQNPTSQSEKNLASIYENYYSFKEIGLSKSRNRAIEKSKGEICVIADDDISYVEDYELILKKAFTENPEADIITFRIVTPEGDSFKNYSHRSFWYDKRKAFKASSIEMAFRAENIKKAGVRFDERFGLGAQYSLGEEAIFLSDAIDCRLQALYLPIDLVYHPFESSGKKSSKGNLFARGAQLARIFGWTFLIWDVLFYLRLMMKAKSYVPVSYLAYLIKGSISFMRFRT